MTVSEKLTALDMHNPEKGRFEDEAYQLYSNLIQGVAEKKGMFSLCQKGKGQKIMALHCCKGD